MTKQWLLHARYPNGYRENLGCFYSPKPQVNYGHNGLLNFDLPVITAFCGREYFSKGVI